MTDTTASADAPYQEAILGVDVLIHECYYSDADAELAALYGHSHASAVAQLALAAKVGRLVLVHINPQTAEDDPVGLEILRRVFPNTVLGEDLMELEV